MRENSTRRLAGYDVPQASRRPIELPTSHLPTGRVPSDSRHPGEWQSLHAPIVTRYRPRAAETFDAPVEVGEAIPDPAAARRAIAAIATSVRTSMGLRYHGDEPVENRRPDSRTSRERPFSTFSPPSDRR